MIFVKICGITRLEDALSAAELGADYLGFNFYPGSKRYIEPEACRQIIAGLDRGGITIQKVGVFVNASLEAIETILDGCRLDLAQLSGNEPLKILEALGERGFKAVRPRSQDEAQAVSKMARVRKAPPALLVDAYQAGGYGGSGQTADWDAAARLAREYPVLLAGGLTPDNISEAIRRVRPWGVDVASGVEEAAGIKDRAKMRAFIQTVKDESVEEIEC
jgi:phosphoribosylanthranilate isomerase